MEDSWPGTLAAVVHVCTRPRETIRAIVDSRPRRHVVPLVLLAGWASVLGPGVPQPWGVAGDVVFPLLGVPVVWGLGWAYAWVGRLLGGTGDAVAVRAALAWSGVPAILAFVVYVVLVAVAGADAAGDGFVGRVAERFTALAGLWVWLLGVIMLAEVHRFSLARALATSVLGSIAFTVPVVLLLALAVVVGILFFDLAPRVLGH